MLDVRESVIAVSVHRRRGSFHFRTQATELARNRAIRKPPRRDRNGCSRSARRCSIADHIVLDDRGWNADRRGDRDLFRPNRADDRDAADGRAVQWNGRRDRGAGVGRGVSPAYRARATPIGAGEATSIVLGTAIGAISFTGSIVAFGKLQEILPANRCSFRFSVSSTR